MYVKTKTDMADGIFVINVGNYIGDSTRSEIEYALNHEKTVEKTGDPENLKEELGDLLLQVMFHSVIAEEEGLFSFDDVVRGISDKMVRRHPHVFNGVTFKRDTFCEMFLLSKLSVRTGDAA